MGVEIAQYEHNARSGVPLGHTTIPSMPGVSHIANLER
jgi:hypothetical protein